MPKETFLQPSTTGGEGPSEVQQISGHFEDARSSPPQRVAASDTELSCDESLSSSGNENYFELENEVQKIRQGLAQLSKQINGISAARSNPANEVETLRAENLALRLKLKSTEDERDSWLKNCRAPTATVLTHKFL